MQGQSTERIQAVQDSIFAGGELGDTVERQPIFFQSRDTGDYEGFQKLNQSSAPEGTNIKGQSKSVQHSHFEPEAAYKKSHSSKISVAKENMDKMQNETKTKNLSDG